MFNSPDKGDIVRKQRLRYLGNCFELRWIAELAMKDLPYEAAETPDVIQTVQAVANKTKF